MKKTFTSVIAAALSAALLLTGCNTAKSSSSSAPAGSEAKSSGASSVSSTGEKKKVALVCDPAGTQVFILMMIEGLNNSAKKYGFEPVVVECADAAAYEDNCRALLQENVDLIIGGGWQAGGAIDSIAKEFPDAADYALIDSTVEATNVKCISYREQEGAYLIGKIAASVVEEKDKVFGAVHVNQGPGSWKWRYGYMEGVKSIKPDATFIFNYTGSYNDPAQAKESALLQYEKGAKFINAAAAGGDIGVFEAALQKGFYTSGQDVDLTTPDNRYIVSSQIKDTKVTIEYLLDQYFGGKWTTDNEEWGIAEGTIGAVHITHDSKNPVSDRLSSDKIAAVKKAAEDIKNGTLDLKNIPAEESYK
ncbi:MAG: BMP family ABC transporter substrate-binding protein [Hydrogenoanaerobacterium sp.]